MCIYFSLRVILKVLVHQINLSLVQTSVCAFFFFLICQKCEMSQKLPAVQTQNPQKCYIFKGPAWQKYFDLYKYSTLVSGVSDSDKLNSITATVPVFTSFVMPPDHLIAG